MKSWEFVKSHMQVLMFGRGFHSAPSGFMNYTTSKSPCCLHIPYGSQDMLPVDTFWAGGHLQESSGLLHSGGWVWFFVLGSDIGATPETAKFLKTENFVFETGLPKNGQNETERERESERDP